MNRVVTMILSLIALVSIQLSNAEEAATQILPTSHLQPFTSLRVDGVMDVVLIQVSPSDPPRIEYDLGDNPADKFKFSVKSSGELVVSQSRNTKSVSRVKANIYYHSLELLRISYADVTLSTPLVLSVSNITLDNGAKLVGEVECLDLDLSLNTESRAEIGGVAKYLNLRAGSATRCEIRSLLVTSARVEASQGAVVALKAGERLEVSVATRSVVKYWGTPDVLRIRKPLLGGELIQVEK